MRVGDRVVYTKAFGRSVGAGPTDGLWRKIGTVVDGDLGGFDPARFVCVLWDGWAHSVTVNRAAITIKGSLAERETIIDGCGASDATRALDAQYEQIWGLNGYTRVRKTHRRRGG